MAYFQTESLWVNELADGVAALVLHVPGSKVNPLARAVLKDFDAALERVEKESRFRLLILRSGQTNHFAAGPGLDELATLRTPDDFVALARQGQDVFARLANLRVPTVAMIAGACIGGGLELALACDYRVAIEESTTRLGLGELELGLLPAWGGTQRLPRVVGLERSLQMLLGERQLSAGKALEWGLVDAVVGRGDEHPPALLERPVKRPRPALPLRTWRQRLMEGLRGARWLVYRGARRLLSRRLADDLPAPGEILETVRHGLEEGFDAGLEREREALARLSQTSAHRNLLRLHMARRQVRQERFPARDAESIKRVAIVGAGTQGSQLVQLAVSHGFQVVVRELDDSALGLAMFRVLSVFQNAIEQGQATKADVQRHLASITGTTAWKGFAEVDLVIESVGADHADRGALLREIEGQASPRTLLVATSATESIDELREGLREPARLGGVHFVAPVGRGSVVEVVNSGGAAERLHELASWVVRLGCLPVVVNDRPGLLVLRIWMSAIHEAILLLQEDMQIAQIEESMRRFGMTRGPLETADQIGARRLEQLAAGLPARFPNMETFFALMVAKGWLGHASKQGFYVYRQRGRPLPNTKITILAGDDPNTFRRGETLSRPDQMKLCERRIVARTINEAARCLEEGVIERADDLDVALAGSGWAPHRGGPLAYARQQGIEDYIRELDEMATRWGPRFAPCPALRELGERRTT